LETERRRTTKEAILSEEFGGGLKHYFCFGAHLWTLISEFEGRMGTLKNGRVHTKFEEMKCVDCGRKWIIVLRWMEWDH